MRKKRVGISRSVVYLGVGTVFVKHPLVPSLLGVLHFHILYIYEIESSQLSLVLSVVG